MLSAFLQAMKVTCVWLNRLEQLHPGNKTCVVKAWHNCCSAKEF